MPPDVNLIKVSISGVGQIQQYFCTTSRISHNSNNTPLLVINKGYAICLFSPNTIKSYSSLDGLFLIQKLILFWQFCCKPSFGFQNISMWLSLFTQYLNLGTVVYKTEPNPIALHLLSDQQNHQFMLAGGFRESMEIHC